jgi:hypothetical protein
MARQDALTFYGLSFYFTLIYAKNDFRRVSFTDVLMTALMDASDGYGG